MSDELKTMGEEEQSIYSKMQQDYRARTSQLHADLKKTRGDLTHLENSMIRKAPQVEARQQVLDNQIVEATAAGDDAERQWLQKEKNELEETTNKQLEQAAGLRAQENELKAKLQECAKQVLDEYRTESPREIRRRLEEFYAYALDMHISLREFASFYHLKLTSRQLRQATAVTRVTKEDRHLRARLEAFLPEA